MAGGYEVSTCGERQSEVLVSAAFHRSGFHRQDADILVNVDSRRQLMHGLALGRSLHGQGSNTSRSPRRSIDTIIFIASCSHEIIFIAPIHRLALIRWCFSTMRLRSLGITRWVYLRYIYYRIGGETSLQISARSISCDVEESPLSSAIWEPDNVFLSRRLIASVYHSAFICITQKSLVDDMPAFIDIIDTRISSVLRDTPVDKITS